MHQQPLGTGQPAEPAGALLEERFQSMALNSANGTNADGTASPAVTPGQGQPPGSPRAARRRPNQAQRRMMSEQLSIPVDHSPAPISPAHHNVSPGYGHQAPFRNDNGPQNHRGHPHQRQNHAYSQSHGQHGYNPDHRQHPQQQQRPQTAYGRPPHPGQSQGQMQMQWQGGTGGPGGTGGHRPYHPSQPHHQQSHSFQGPHPHSFQGPAAHDGAGQWRSHQPRPSFNTHQQQASRALFDPSGPHHGHQHSASRMYQTKPADLEAQVAWLKHLCEQHVASAAIEHDEIMEKESFRVLIERLSREALAKYEYEVNGRRDFPPQSARLMCFGSLSSGFATKASDMDLGLLSPLSHPLPDTPNSPIPRLIEKAFLEAGLGARLITRTRVPIIKLCSNPPQKLLQDLLDARACWEKGLLTEGDGADADAHADDETEAKAGPGDVPGDVTGDVPGDVPADVPGDVPDEGKPAGHERRDSDTVIDAELDADKYASVLASLRQAPGQSLGNYFGSAKRVLRKLGVREVTHATLRDYSEKRMQILTDVSFAFVDGIANEKLRTRLLSTQSLSVRRSVDGAYHRSPYGVYLQAEGEQLAMLWDDRETDEGSAKSEEDALAKLKYWASLQNKPAHSWEVLGYNKMLQTGVDSLRRISSLHIASLEQGQYETPNEYYTRALKPQLKPRRDAGAKADAPASVVTRHYIAGIYNPEIRAEVEAFAKTLDRPSLRVVARRHMSLHLAADFERALARGLYSSEDAAVIQAYVAELKGPMVLCSPDGQEAEYVVPNSLAAIAVRNLLLEDPSKLWPNQPRDPYRDRLEFPKAGLGVQCDINFSAHLALQNSLLLRCYSHTDSRVRPLVLFVKHWAKMRGINTPYRGTLSSYGYVLMVLHYLVNIARPFVCPNLQQLAKPLSEDQMAQMTPEQIEETTTCRGHDVRFWRNEAEIVDLASRGLLNGNTESVGSLLRGFFEYYAQSNMMSTGQARGLDWGRDVLSLRTPGGLRSKHEKGWTGARTVIEKMPRPNGSQTGDAQPTTTTTTTTTEETVSTEPKEETKEVKHRYLFAIEDPFELTHNVARTVTHTGIVAIRDEFRRAWRLIKSVDAEHPVAAEALLGDVTDTKDRDRETLRQLLTNIHGLQ